MPELDEESRIFEFKIKQCQWIAFGVCHKNIVAQKSYSWNGELGDGAYMISSARKSFSNHQAEVNNVNKAFKFKENDIVICHYDYENKIVRF